MCRKYHSFKCRHTIHFISQNTVINLGRNINRQRNIKHFNHLYLVIKSIFGDTAFFKVEDEEKWSLFPFYYKTSMLSQFAHLCQSLTPRPHVTTSVRPRPQLADMWKISTSLKQPYNVGNIFSDNIHVHWSYVRSIYMVVK